MEFMRKYIHVAKMIKPVLTEEAANYIAEEYSRLRSQSLMNSDVARVSPTQARRRETEAQAPLSPYGCFPPWMCYLLVRWLAVTGVSLTEMSLSLPPPRPPQSRPVRWRR